MTHRRHALLLALGLAAAPAAAQGPALAPVGDLSDLRADGTLAVPLPMVAAAPVSFDGRGLPDNDTAPATVLADSVTLSGDRQLDAAGGVVVWYQGTRLIADRVQFDGTRDRVTITGPIHLTRPADEGSADEVVIVADSAELDSDLRAGLLRGARLVLARELQMAAREVRLSGEGRMATLTHVVASSCRVCAASPVPIWEIRARSIVHDADTRRLTFDHPQLRAFGLPVASLPLTVTAPGPGVERMSGVLRPRIRTTSKLGFGAKLPYFMTLGDSADLTLTPYLAVNRTATLEWRARQAFASGAVLIEGAVSRDDIREGETRGYVFGSARFALPSDFTLTAQLQAVSDLDYLSDYGKGDPDRLWSGVTLERVRAAEVIVLRGGTYRTQREGEVQATLPTQVVDALWRRQFALGGGMARLEWSAHAHRRPSDLDVLGRDVARASLGAGWTREVVLGHGVLGRAEGRLDADLWRTTQDSGVDEIVARAAPTLALGLRWPLIRAGAGATDIVEPHVQLVWSPDRSADDSVANEDGIEAPLDEGSLFALDRIPGRDLRETGLRANLGLSWTRVVPNGGSVAVSAGRVWREDDSTELATTGTLRSDWLLSANVTSARGLAAVGRLLLDDDRDVTAAEARVGILRPELRLTAGYARFDDMEEIAFDGGWQVADGWWASAATRYDLDADRTRRAAIGVTWRTDCITLEAAVERDWGLPGEPADTGFDLSVQLGGFGAPSADRTPGTVARRSCMR